MQHTYRIIKKDDISPQHGVHEVIWMPNTLRSKWHGCPGDGCGLGILHLCWLDVNNEHQMDHGFVPWIYEPKKMEEISNRFFTSTKTCAQNMCHFKGTLLFSKLQPIFPVPQGDEPRGANGMGGASHGYTPHQGRRRAEDPGEGVQQRVAQGGPDAAGDEDRCHSQLWVAFWANGLGKVCGFFGFQVCWMLVDVGCEFKIVNCSPSFFWLPISCRLGHSD